MMECLGLALAQLTIVDEHLWVAQHTSGVPIGQPTAQASEDARDALSELLERVRKTPLHAE